MRISFKTITNEIFNCASDLLLYQIGLIGASFGGAASSRGVYKTFYKANKFMNEINHETLRGAWKRLIRQGLIEVVKEEGFYKPMITQLAKERLKSVCPRYQIYRPWDKKIYIITYDIPEEQSGNRRILRDLIKRLGGAMLQKSVWICPYNIKDVLNKLTKERKTEGTVIVSNTGKDGAIGDRSIEELIIEIYNLELLNERYKEFLSLVQERNKNKQELMLLYLSILKQDPQLPFKLLPYWWTGDIAYKEYKKLTAYKLV